MTKNHAPKKRQRARAAQDGSTYMQASSRATSQRRPLIAASASLSDVRSAVRTEATPRGHLPGLVQVDRRSLAAPAHVLAALEDSDFAVGVGSVDVEAWAHGPVVRGALTADGASVDWGGLDQRWTEVEQEAADAWLQAVLALTTDLDRHDELVLTSVQELAMSLLDHQFGGHRIDRSLAGIDHGIGPTGELPLWFPCPQLEAVPGWFVAGLYAEPSAHEADRIDILWSAAPSGWGYSHPAGEWVASCARKVKTATGEVRFTDWRVASDAPSGTVRAAAALVRNGERINASALAAFSELVRFRAGLPLANARRDTLRRWSTSAPGDPMSTPDATVVQQAHERFRDGVTDDTSWWRVPQGSALHAALNRPNDIITVVGNDTDTSADVAQWIRQYGLSTSPISTLQTQIGEGSDASDFWDSGATLANGLQFTIGGRGGIRYDVASHLPLLPPPPPDGKLRYLCAVVTPTTTAPPQWQDEKHRVQLLGVFDSIQAFTAAVRESGVSTWSASSIGARRQAPAGVPVLTAPRVANLLYISTPDGRHPGVPVEQALRPGVKQPEIAAPSGEDLLISEHEATERQERDGGRPTPPPARPRPDRRKRAMPSKARAIDIRVGATSTTLPLWVDDEVRAIGDDYRDVLDGARLGENVFGDWVLEFTDDIGSIIWGFGDRGLSVDFARGGSSRWVDPARRARAVEWFKQVEEHLTDVCAMAEDREQLALELTLGWQANNVRSVIECESDAGVRPGSGLRREHVAFRHDPLVAVPLWMGLELSFATRTYCFQEGCLLDIDTTGYSGYTQRPIVAHLMEVHGKEALQIAPGNPDTVKAPARKLLKNYRIAVDVGRRAWETQIAMNLGVGPDGYLSQT